MSGSSLFAFALLLCFVVANLAHPNECVGSPITVMNDGKYEVSWKFDKAIGKMIFTVTVHGILDKTKQVKGWVALGFMHSQSEHPPSDDEIKADFVVAMLMSKKKVKIQDCNTMKDKATNLQLDKLQNYTNIVKLTKITRKDNKVVFGVSRKLDTKDKEDVAFTAGPMWLIASYGLDDFRSCSKVSIGSINDNKNITRVCIIPPNNSGNKTENAKPNWTHKAVLLARQHWIGVIIGIAGAVTLVAVVVVYCMCRRSPEGYKKKKVTMSFYKENEEDDEARVAMLSTQMT